jgi:hypothetical protein
MPIHDGICSDSINVSQKTHQTRLIYKKIKKWKTYDNMLANKIILVLQIYHY